MPAGTAANSRALGAAHFGSECGAASLRKAQLLLENAKEDVDKERLETAYLADKDHRKRRLVTLLRFLTPRSARNRS